MVHLLHALHFTQQLKYGLLVGYSKRNVLDQVVDRTNNEERTRRQSSEGAEDALKLRQDIEVGQEAGRSDV